MVTFVKAVHVSWTQFNADTTAKSRNHGLNSKGLNICMTVFLTVVA